MSIVRYFKKLQQLDALIRRRATGNQHEFCRKTFMSRSLLNEYLSEMRELGFPIDYDRQKRTYYYTEEGNLVSKLFERKMTVDESKKINGGNGEILNFEITGYMVLYNRNTVRTSI